MKLRIQNWNRNAEAGIALLISIFALLLICVAGIAMIVASGTESALTGNYQSSTAVYYAALAGLEEGRGRLTFRNPNYINNTVPNFLPPGGGTLPVGNVLYIVNGNGVNPLDSGNPTSYPDLEYDQEFGPNALSGANAAGTVFTTPSVSPIAGLPGPAYKWVRINAITESSINVDVDGGGQDATTALYYDGAHLNRTNTGGQALEVTALAAYPNGSQKILQYVTARTMMDLNLPAALTMDGNNVQMSLPYWAGFYMNGNDQYSVGTCNPDTGKPVTSIGFTNQTDSSQNNITTAIPTDNRGNYIGLGPYPNVFWVGNGQTTRPALDPILQTVTGLNNLVQIITNNADARITGPATQNDMPPGMSTTNPMTVVVNGDLTIAGDSHFTGYGLLLVTGTLEWKNEPESSWNGIVLVIGKGVFQAQGGGSGMIKGAMLIATTVDGTGAPLPNSAPLGSPKYSFTQQGNLGITYSSCWIKAAQPRAAYKIVSFREIPQ